MRCSHVPCSHTISSNPLLSGVNIDGSRSCSFKG
jgi:hypothetical protein